MILYCLVGQINGSAGQIGVDTCVYYKTVESLLVIIGFTTLEDVTRCVFLIGNER